MYLQSVLVNYSGVDYLQAKALAQRYIKNKHKTFFNFKDNVFVFRNIPEKYMCNLKKKTIDEKVTLIYGDILPSRTISAREEVA